jgi:hypothetical protein
MASECEVLTWSVLKRARETKIAKHEASVGCDEDIRRLDVAVQHPGGVSGVEGRPYLRGNLEREATTFTRRPRAAHRNVKGTAGTVLRDEVGVAGREVLIARPGIRKIWTVGPTLAAVVHGEDMPVAQSSDEVGLLLKAGSKLRRGGEGRGDEFDRNLTGRRIGAQIPRAIHDGATTVADRFEQLVRAEPAPRPCPIDGHVTCPRPRGYASPGGRGE